MKKLYMLALACLLGIASANAVIHQVDVGNNTFTPASFSANIGDTVRWVLVAGTHTTTSSSVPSGAATWDQTLTSSGVTTFDYVITTAGQYAYVCSFHTGMSGGFSVSSSTGIESLAGETPFTAYPNPFRDKLTITHSAIDGIAIYNMLGAKISTEEVAATETQTTLELSHLPSGVYFFSTMKEGRIQETKRIVKTR